jgi:hypothetical protein
MKIYKYESDEIKEFILQNGWTYKGKCNCNGVPTHKYELNTPDGEFKLRLRQSSFLLSKPNYKFIRYSTIDIKKVINEISEKFKTTV